MDRTGADSRFDDRQERDGAAVEFVLPSRAAAIDALRGGLEAQAGPVLLTGDPGVGKSWVCRLLREQLPSCWRWGVVDLTPSVGPAGLYRLISRGFGLSVSATADPSAGRADLEDSLLGAAADGVRWVLVVEEAHNGTDEVLEEVRVLSNRLGHSGALAGVVLVGQNALALRLRRQPLVALGLRVALRAHLGPFEFEELHAALVHLDPARPLVMRELERLHRDVAGNPLLALRRARTAKVTPWVPTVRNGQAVALPVENDPRDATEGEPEMRPPLDLPAAVPARPPLQVEEGVVEVGWDAGQATLPEEMPFMVAASGAGTAPQSAGVLAETRGDEEASAEEFVEDRYAAIQAWNEWARSQAEDSAASLPPTDVANPSALHEAADEHEPLVAAEMDLAGPGPAHAEVRAEAQHGFAPYSQLFSRLRLPHEAP